MRNKVKTPFKAKVIAITVLIIAGLSMMAARLPDQGLIVGLLVVVAWIIHIANS